MPVIILRYVSLNIKQNYYYNYYCCDIEIFGIQALFR